MGKLLREVNEFFTSTSIHGFPYISDTQTRSTRIIWTVIVIAALGGASYFLYQIVEGFDEKYVSTTIETRGIQEFPFPAVTFHPGQFNSEKGLLKNFLNQFEFTRYVDNRNDNQQKNPLENNEKFMNLYGWLVSPMNDKFFDAIQKWLINDQARNNKGQTYLQSKKKMFKNEACSLVALFDKKKKKMDREIKEIYLYNMYKFNYFPDLQNVIRKQVSPMIKNVVSEQNLTRSDISESCNDEKNIDYKTEMEALLLSYIYIFQDGRNSGVGAGDLATSSLETRLSRGKYTKPPIPEYISTHTLLTNMYNAMVNGSLPLSVFDFPSFFVLPDKTFMLKEWKDEHEMKVRKMKNRLELLNIPDEAVRNYHYLWDTFSNSKENFTLYCLEEKNRNKNCSNRNMEFVLAENPTHYARVAVIRKNPDRGILVEGEAKEPPCKNPYTIKKFKIESMCSFFENITVNRNPFLTAMMFTKQNPVSSVEVHEIHTLFSNASASKFGYTLKKNWVNIIFHIPLSFLHGIFRHSEHRYLSRFSKC